MPSPSKKTVPGTRKLIALLVDHISDPFFACLARRIDRRARSMGYHLIFGSTEGDRGSMPKLLSVFDHMDAAVYIIAPPPGIEPDIKELLSKGKLVVLLEKKGADTLVFVDNKLTFIPAAVQPLDEMAEQILQCIAAHPGEKGNDKRMAPIVLPTRMVIGSSPVRAKTIQPLAPVFIP